MTVGRAASVALAGLEGHLVEVEADVGAGLPGMHVVGLGDAAVSEARSRTRTAAVNSGLGWPRTKVVVSMSPASLRKHGSAFDLAITCAVLSAGLDPGPAGDAARDRLAATVLLGELGLDGAVRDVPGVLAAVLAARDAGVRAVVVPEGCGPEAALVGGVAVACAADLAQLWRWVVTGEGLAAPGEPRPAPQPAAPDMADVHGQEEARRALEVAAAGRHHLLFTGAPGTGKSMLAARLPGILPPLGERAALEVTAICSIAGHGGGGLGPAAHPPFVAPHHTVSAAALLGGGPGVPQPGAVSLAHHGVLFLDEVALMPGRHLDALRVPLETGTVSLHRSRHRVSYPARFQLVAAANPCRCGAADPGECRCSPGERRRHMASLSGPLLDRIDVRVRLHPRHSVLAPEPGEPSSAVRERVAGARGRAAARWAGLGLGEAVATAEVPGPVLRRHAPPDEEGLAWLAAVLADGAMTQRGVDRTLRVAWTLADLAGRARPGLGDVADAAALHSDAEEVLA
ncbi:YifB family Mg chelatase-like AAA ATPase [Corynebacterium sp. 335C]